MAAAPICFAPAVEIGYCFSPWSRQPPVRRIHRLLSRLSVDACLSLYSCARMDSTVVSDPTTFGGWGVLPATSSGRASMLLIQRFGGRSRWRCGARGARASPAERSLRQPGEHLLQSDGEPPAEVPRRYRLPGVWQDRLCLPTSPASCAAGATASNPCPTWRGLPPVLRRGVEQHQFGRSSGRRLRRQCNAYPPGRTTESPGVRLLCSLQEHDRCARKTRQCPCMLAVYV